MAKKGPSEPRMTARDVFFFRCGVRQGIHIVDSPLDEEDREERADFYSTDEDGNYDNKHAERVFRKWAGLTKHEKTGWNPKNV
jgi:hypothetical protein